MSNIVDSVAPAADELQQLNTMTNETNGIVITDLDGKKHTLVGQTFNTFKTKRVLQMLAAVREKVDVVTLISEIVMLATPAQDDEGNANRTLAAFSAIPKLMDFAPDLLLDFSSLAIIPNREVARAYRENTLDALVREKREWLEFEFDASVMLSLLNAYIPHLGIDFLVREFGNLNRSVEKVTPQNLKDITGS